MKDFLKILHKNLLLKSSFSYFRKLERLFKPILVAISKFRTALSIEYFIVTFFSLGIFFFLIIFYLLAAIEKYKVNATTARPITASSYPSVEGVYSPTISARAFVIYDTNARIIIEGKNEHLRFAPASTVKIMTILVCLDYYNLDQVLIAKNLSTVEGSKMELVEGEHIKVRDLLYGLMLPSGNDAAYTLASSYPGGISAFVERMNKKAYVLGLENTHFVDPAGFDDDNYTTAYDLVKLGSYGLENPVFAQIVRTVSITVFDETGKISHPLENLNKLLGRREVIGIKTGFTNEAGGVLVTALSFDNSTYVVAILKSEDRFFDTEEVIDKVIKRIQREDY